MRIACVPLFHSLMLPYLSDGVTDRWQVDGPEEQRLPCSLNPKPEMKPVGEAPIATEEHVVGSILLGHLSSLSGLRKRRKHRNGRTDNIPRAGELGCRAQ